MSNGKDHPGEYRFLPLPVGIDAQQQLAEIQEAQGFLLAAMNEETMVFYKKGQ